MYHNLLPDDSPYGYKNQSITLFNSAFIKQIKLLRQYYNIVSIDEYVDYFIENNKVKNKSITITFDDGTYETYECLKRNYSELKISSTMFISTCQIDNGPLIWGAYLNALCYEDIYDSLKINNRKFYLNSIDEQKQTRGAIIELGKISGDPIEYVNKIRRKYPIPNKIMQFYRGVSSKQLEQSDKYKITIGSHTVNHPYLCEISKDDQKKEILNSKIVLEKKVKKEIKYFAYPSGDYNNDIIRILKSLKYRAAFATNSRFLGNEKLFEFSRIGIYSPSILRFSAKIFKEHLKL